MSFFEEGSSNGLRAIRLQWHNLQIRKLSAVEPTPKLQNPLVLYLYPLDLPSDSQATLEALRPGTLKLKLNSLELASVYESSNLWRNETQNIASWAV